MKTKPSKVDMAVRTFACQTVAQVMAMAMNTARVVEDADLMASLERVDALLYHEAVNFLKLPLMPRRKVRRKKS